MANYKVVDADQLEEDLGIIAAAIRTKGGTEELLDFPDGFVEAVENMEAGGGTDIGDAIMDRSVTEIESDITAIGQYALRGCTKLVEASFPKATSLGTYALYGCTAMASFSAPLVKSISAYAFQSCSYLVDANFPVATSIYANAFYGCSQLRSAIFPVATSMANYSFYNCTNLYATCFPKIATLGNCSFQACKKMEEISLPLAKAVTAGCFHSCFVLEVADFGAAASIAATAFYNCYSLKALVLRNATMATLANVSAFTNCYSLKGTVNTTYNPYGRQGAVLVPRALLDSYAAATNWVSAGVQFLALEDWTIDGTTTGEIYYTALFAELGFTA